MSRMAARGRYYPSTGPSGRYSFVSAVTGALSKLLSSLTVIGSGSTVSSDWSLGNFSFTDGVAGSEQLLTPSGYRSGGMFFVNSGSLPSTITLSDAGLIQYDGTPGVSAVNVTFGYTEPYVFPTLSLYANKTGNFPYMSTLFANEGTVPSGRHVYSLDDSNLRGSVVNTWPDGSARVIVLHSRSKSVTATQTHTVRVQLAPTSFSQGTALDYSFIQTVVSTVSVNFGTLQTLTLASATPSRVWWANSECICARYVLSCGLGVMEAQIDIHAFASGLAFVEIVIENCKFNSSVSSTKPASQTYSSAPIQVNGTTIINANPPTPTEWPGVSGTPIYPSGLHTGLRAFYVAAWVSGGTATALRGASDPFIEVMHDIGYMQNHPILHGGHARPDITNYNTFINDSMPYAKQGTLANRVYQTYDLDLYSPWDYGRNKGYNMGSPSNIGPLSERQVRYVASGNRFVRRSVIADGLVQLSWGLNYRDSTTNNVPTYDQLGTKFNEEQGGGWPRNSEEPQWESAHQPAGPILAFLCQPSPRFIEQLQGQCLWNSTRTGESPTPQQSVQLRGMGWNIRQLTHAVFLTPDSDAWKTGGQSILHQTVMLMDAYRTSGKFPLMAYWQYTPDKNLDPRTYALGYNFPMWNMVYLVSETYKAHKAKVLHDTTQASDLETFVTWQLKIGVQFVNQQPNGGWRYHTQYMPCGYRNAVSPPDPSSDGFPYVTDIQQPSSWADVHSFYYSDTPPSPSGKWMWEANVGSLSSQANPQPTLQGQYSLFTERNTANSPTFGPYCDTDWPIFVHAAEMDVPGADQMWNTIVTNITNISTWMDGFKNDPRFGLWPRNYTLDK